MVSGILIERSDNEWVETTMNRVKITLASLIPALWLVASVSCLFESPCSECAGYLFASSVSESEDCSHHSSGSDICFEQAARWSRRFEHHSGVPGVVSPAAVPQLQFATGNDFIRFSEYPRLPEFAKSWQFYLRTAPDVRAPSTVS
jgi:hypothetical protein